MRIVLDTNILISACMQPKGNEARVVELVLLGYHTAFVSTALLAEYHEVTSREKFAKTPEKFSCLQSTRAKLEAIAKRVYPTTAVSVAKEEDDNRVIECALAAGAAYLITGNLRHFPTEHAGVQILNAMRFLAITGQLP